jgi:hypothetical protein
MLFKWGKILYCEIQIENIGRMCGQNAKLVNVKAVSAYSSYCALKVEQVTDNTSDLQMVSTQFTLFTLKPIFTHIVIKERKKQVNSNFVRRIWKALVQNLNMRT